MSFDEKFDAVESHSQPRLDSKFTYKCYTSSIINAQPNKIQANANRNRNKKKRKPIKIPKNQTEINAQPTSSEVLVDLGNTGSKINALLTYYPAPGDLFRLTVHSLGLSFTFSPKNSHFKKSDYYSLKVCHKNTNFVPDSNKNIPQTTSFCDRTWLWFTIYFKKNDLFSWNGILQRINNVRSSIGNFFAGVVFGEWYGTQFERIHELQSQIAQLCKNIVFLEELKLSTSEMKILSQTDRSVVTRSVLMINAAKKLISDIKNKLAVFGSVGNIIMKSMLKLEEMMEIGSNATNKDFAFRVNIAIKCFKKMNLRESTKAWEKQVLNLKKNADKLRKELQKVMKTLAEHQLTILPHRALLQTDGREYIQNISPVEKLNKYCMRFGFLGAGFGMIASIICVCFTAPPIGLAMVGVAVTTAVVGCGGIGCAVGYGKDCSIALENIREANEINAQIDEYNLAVCMNGRKISAANLEIIKHNVEVSKANKIAIDIADELNLERDNLLKKLKNVDRNLKNVGMTMDSLQKEVNVLGTLIDIFEDGIGTELNDDDCISMACKKQHRDIIVDFKKYFSDVLSGVVNVIQIICKFENQYIWENICSD